MEQQYKNFDEQSGLQNFSEWFGWNYKVAEAQKQPQPVRRSSNWIDKLEAKALPLVLFVVGAFVAWMVYTEFFS